MSPGKNPQELNAVQFTRLFLRSTLWAFTSRAGLTRQVSVFNLHDIFISNTFLQLNLSVA